MVNLSIINPRYANVSIHMKDDVATGEIRLRAPTALERQMGFVSL
jgi:hypothetical protein